MTKLALKGEWLRRKALAQRKNETAVTYPPPRDRWRRPAR